MSSQHKKPTHPHMRRPAMGAALLACLVTACSPNTGSVSRAAAYDEPTIMHTTAKPPPGAREGSCWGKHVTPAKIETVTHQVMLQPAEVRTDGSVSAPAVFKTETTQAIVKERSELWFETPCTPELTPEFVSSVQRALKVRGHYKGAVTGYIDARTRKAIRAYQAPQGLDSGILSLAAARKLGLSAYQRSEDN